MGLNFQKSDCYAELRRQERKTGISVAQQTAAATAGQVDLGALVTMKSVSIFTGLLFNDWSKSEKEGNPTDGKLSTDGQDYQKQIDAILKKNTVSSVDELQGKLIDDRMELAEIENISAKKTETETKINNLKEENTKAETRIKTLTSDISSLKNEIFELEYKQNYEGELSIEESMKLEAAKADLKLLEQEKTNLETSVSTNNDEITKLNTAVSEYDSQIRNSNPRKTELTKSIQALEADINIVNELTQKLKESTDGDDNKVLKSMANEDTANINSLLKQLKEARSNGDTDKEQAIKEKLETAVNAFCEANPNNKTYDGLMKMLNINVKKS